MARAGNTFLARKNRFDQHQRDVATLQRALANPDVPEDVREKLKGILQWTQVAGGYSLISSKSWKLAVQWAGGVPCETCQKFPAYFQSGRRGFCKQHEAEFWKADKAFMKYRADPDVVLERERDINRVEYLTYRLQRLASAKRLGRHRR